MLYITDPSGGIVPCTVRQTSDRIYQAEYIPVILGELCTGTLHSLTHT